MRLRKKTRAYRGRLIEDLCKAQGDPDYLAHTNTMDYASFSQIEKMCFSNWNSKPQITIRYDRVVGGFENIRIAPHRQNKNPLFTPKNAEKILSLTPTIPSQEFFASVKGDTVTLTATIELFEKVAGK